MKGKSFKRQARQYISHYIPHKDKTKVHTSMEGKIQTRLISIESQPKKVVVVVVFVGHQNITLKFGQNFLNNK